jgi:predicted transcriptional regulator
VRAASQADFDTAKQNKFKVAVANAMGTSAEILSESISVEISYTWITVDSAVTGATRVITEVTVIMCSVSEYVLRSRDYAKRTCAEMCALLPVPADCHTDPRD